MVTLEAPIWLILVIPLAVSLMVWRMPSRLLMGLRMALLVLLILALAQLAVTLPQRGGYVVVVADRSRSMPEAAEQAHGEAIRIVQSEMAETDRLAVVSFGDAARVEHAPQAGGFGGFVQQVGPHASNLHDALETALALIPAEAPGRILVMSDGRWTGRDPVGIAARAAARSVAVDHRLLQRPAAGDLAIADIDAPDAVHPQEAFMLTAWVRSATSGEVDYELLRGQTRLAAGRRQVRAGLNRLTFRDLAEEPGTLAYVLRVKAAGADPVPENNAARILVGVRGPRAILHLTEKPDSGLQRLLSGGGLDVRPRAPAEVNWTLPELSNYSAVLIEEVAAGKIGRQGMQNLAQWVRETGSGLMMTGGQTSFGPGGYFKSPLDPVLPVSMELRREHRKHRLAIVVVLDRSGSMAAPVPGGRTKMDLANLASAQVLDMLTAMDEIGVLAVDSSPHLIAPLTKLSQEGSRDRIRADILRIQSMGGGIFVYVGLSQAASLLQKAEAGTRHIILFSDARDSEQPGKYKELLEDCRKANITCSVIGLGKDTDVDAALLKDIAARGGGRVLFSENPEELPRLFAQDMFVVARSTFVDEPTPIKATAGLATLSDLRFPKPPPVGGYNLTYLREGATLAAVTEDEYKAPVVASWQAGTGRVLCYAGQADGKYTGAIASWDQVGAFFASLARWTSGDSATLADGSVLVQQVREGIARVQLHLDPDRKNLGYGKMPQVSLLRGQPGQEPVAEHLSMAWVGPDTLGIEFALKGTEAAIATVNIDDQPSISLPPVTLPYSPEFKPQTEGRGPATLRRLAQVTAGSERGSYSGIWESLPRSARFLDLSPYLLLAAVLLVLVEVLERRTGLLSTAGEVWSRYRRADTQEQKETEAEEAADVAPAAPRRRRRPAPGAGSAPAASSAKPPVKEKKEAETPPAGESEGSVLDALGRARQRARNRTDRK